MGELVILPGPLAGLRGGEGKVWEVTKEWTEEGRKAWGGEGLSLSL